MSLAPDPLELAVRGRDGEVRVALHVRPGARRSAFVGLHGDRVKVAVHAPPVDGKANRELVRWLAKVLRLRRAEVELVAGGSSRDKTVTVNASRATVLAAIRSALDSAPTRRKLRT